MMLRHLTNGFLSALIAPPCAVCARVLDAPLDGAVCERCWRSILAIDSPVLRSNLPSVACLQAIGLYEGSLREILHALKYDGRRSVAPRLSQLMAKHGAAVLDAADLVVPVPLHPKRQRERGFNQAEDLASGLGLPMVRALRRTTMTRPQVELPAAERQLNVEGAFAMNGRSKIVGKTLVLVDDVTTTGATLVACAKVLQAAGAHEVRALTAARVVTGQH